MPYPCPVVPTPTVCDCPGSSRHILKKSLSASLRLLRLLRQRTPRNWNFCHQPHAGPRRRLKIASSQRELVFQEDFTQPDKLPGHLAGGHTHTRARTHTHEHTHMRARTHMHTRTHAHTHLSPVTMFEPFCFTTLPLLLYLNLNLRSRHPQKDFGGTPELHCSSPPFGHID